MKKLRDLIPWGKKASVPDENTGDYFFEMDRHMDPFFNRPFCPPFFKQDGFRGGHRLYPDVDVVEGKKTITVEAELPGADARNIDLSLDGRVLTIRGEKKQEREDNNGSYYHLERFHGCFNRKIELPADVEHNDAEATFKRGILKIKFKKAKEAETRRIIVNAA